MKATTLAALSLAATFAAPAVAQTANYSGQWECQISHQQNNLNGSYYSGMNRNFLINVAPNGQYEAQGTETGMAGTLRFMSQGAWNTSSGFFATQGQEQIESPLGIMPGLFMLAAMMDPDNRTMRLQAPVTSQQTGEVARNNTMCQRRG